MAPRLTCIWCGGLRYWHHYCGICGVRKEPYSGAKLTEFKCPICGNKNRTDRDFEVLICDKCKAINCYTCPNCKATVEAPQGYKDVADILCERCGAKLLQRSTIGGLTQRKKRRWATEAVRFVRESFRFSRFVKYPLQAGSKKGLGTTSGKVERGRFSSEDLQKSGSKILSNQEIKYLVAKAESCVDSSKLGEALEFYSRIIEGTPPHPHHYKRRGWIYRMMGEFDKAINDMNKAIELDPDDGSGYWERGACHAHKLSLEKRIETDRKKQLLVNIIKDYKESVRRTPASSEAWLAILETDMLLHNWDDAVSDYGVCKPYIDTKEYQLTRCWLGCLALIFSGDSLEEEDMRALYDNSVRLRRTHWCVSEIDSLFSELEEMVFDGEKLNKAKGIHEKYIDHFSEPPIRGYLQDHLRRA